MKPILLILSFLYSHIAFSQGVVVAADKMNVLYIGIENPMSIAAENYSCKDLVVEISQGTITKDEDYSCRHIAKVTTPGKATIIIKNKNGKLLGEVEFRVKRVPDPVAKIGGMNGGVIGKSKFKAQMGIIAELENFDYDLRFKIIEFKLGTTSNNQLFVSETNGPLFSNEMKRIIKNVASGDVFLFTDIVAMGPDGTKRQLMPTVLYIDYQKTFSCDTNYLYSPHEKLLSIKAEDRTQYIYLNTCKTTDIAEGKLENRIKIDWWDYRKVIGNDTLMMRKEKVIGDTTMQVLYENGVMSKKQTLKDDKLIGDYIEYHLNRNIKVKGFYICDTVLIDSVESTSCGGMSLFPPEKVQRAKMGTLKSGTWQYFNEAGVLIKEEKYLNGVLVE
jgi:antitoxin component YwqK of YwqJK toxin-antitoxin module